ncbi:MAG: phosphoglycerate mutase, partial [Clostridia bacterium]
MKYLVLLCDGMADFPLEQLNNKTPMEIAKKPNMNRLCKKSIIGLAKTVPACLSPGSDVANLSVLGYDPLEFYTGRSPLEAASIGINLKENDLAFRCNLVTLSNEDNFEDKTMLDYCADDISTAEATILIKDIEKTFGTDAFTFYPAISYRHCMVLNNGGDKTGIYTPPHDITGQKIKEYLPKGEDTKQLFELTKKIHSYLNN